MIFVSTSSLKGKNIIDIIEQFSCNNITNIELSGGIEYYERLEQDLINIYNSKKIKFVSHGYFLPVKDEFVVNLASTNEEIYKKSIEYYLKNLELLKKIQCDTLSIHAGFFVEITPQNIGKSLKGAKRYNIENCINNFCEAYEKIQKACKKENIQLYLENNVIDAENYNLFHKENILMMTDYHSICKVRKKIKFNLLLDIAHLYVSCKTLSLDFMEECKMLNNEAKWIHISENNGEKDQHLPLCAESKILNAYIKFFDNSIPLTLESKGNIEEILKSIEYINYRIGRKNDSNYTC